MQVAEAYRQYFPHSNLPMFHARDVLPLLEGDDREFAAATELLDGGRVYYPQPPAV